MQTGPHLEEQTVVLEAQQDCQPTQQFRWATKRYAVQMNRCYRLYDFNMLGTSLQCERKTIVRPKRNHIQQQH
jgi:hypothetical protein